MATSWVTASMSGLVNVLEVCSMRLQMLAQKLDGRNYDDNDEAAKAPATAPVGDELDIPHYLKRT